MYYSVVLQREILTRNVSFQRCLFFLNFLNFASLLSFFWREMGLRHRSTRTQHSSSKIHPFVSKNRAVLLGKIFLLFWASPHEKEKEHIKRDLLLSLRARDKNAPLLFDEMMRTTTTEKASLCVSCFSSLQRKKKTKKEVRLRVSLRSIRFRATSFFSLVFSLSLSLFGTMELTFDVFHPLTLSLSHQEVSKNTRSIIVRATSKSSGTNKNTNNHTNNTTNNNENNNRKTQRAYRVRSTATNDFQQQQQKPYASYREKHGYNWTYGAAEDDVNDDDESGEYGSVSEADAREAARNWLCTIGRQGQTSPIDFEKAQYNARRGKRVSEEFRGTLLDDPFTNNPKVFEFMRTRRGPMVGKLGKALRHVHGDEAYESYLGKHVNRHIRLARILKLWRINFHIRFGREPGYDDMPSNLKTLELQYINIGFKLRELDG